MKLALIAAPAFALAGIPVDSVQPRQITTLDATQIVHEATLTPAQVMQVQKITLETIRNNSNLLLAQIDRVQSEKIQKVQAEDLNLIANNRAAILNQNNQLSFGNPKANVVLIEFIDYNCNHCKNLVRTLKEVTYNNKDIRVIVKEMPILGDRSVNAAKAVIAASRQDKYLTFQKYLLTSNDSFTEKNLLLAAKKLKLNVNKFEKDFKSLETKQYIAANLKLAESLKINATPTLVVTNTTNNFGKIIPGELNFQQINYIVDDARTNTLR